MTTLQQIKHSQSSIGKGYTNLEFIMLMYKSSTLPRLFYHLNLSVNDIDDNKVITKYLKSEKVIKDGFTQDKLFDLFLAN